MNNPTESTCPKCGAPIADEAPQGLCPKCVLEGAATLPETSPKSKAPPAIEEVAPHFPDLEIIELIGAGGMGAVYMARQPKLERIVALKILAHDLGEDPAFVERFNREGRVLARLSHSNIVAVFDTGTAGPFAYLLMEYVDGVNLRQAMRTGGFTPSEALSLVQDICSALKFAHEEGILHRDIKPENVLIDSKGQVKIADFGIAKLVGQEETDDVTLTMDGSILGSPQYMAPEQIETPGDVDQRADIYSLGVVLYEMLTGELPLGRFALPSEKGAIDARIDEIVLRTLAKEREARFQTAGEVRTEVEAITSTPVTAENPAPGENTDSGRTIALLGAWLQLGGVLGLFGTIIGMLSHFGSARSQSDFTATALAEGIGSALIPTVIGMGIGLVGTVLLLIALFAKQYRAKWFYWFMMIYSILSLMAFPIGTAIGIVCLFYLAKRKEEFGVDPDGSIKAAPKGSPAPTASAPSPDTPETARFSTLSAVFAGIGLLMAGTAALSFPFIAVDMPGGAKASFLALAFLSVAIPAMLGTVLGSKALEEIRRSEGRKSGFGSALFGALTLPSLVIIAATGFLMAMMMEWTGYYHTYPKPVFTSVVAPVFAGFVALMFLIRLVWRWARRSPRSEIDITLRILVVIAVAIFGFFGYIEFFWDSEKIDAEVTSAAPGTEALARSRTDSSKPEPEGQPSGPEVGLNLTVGAGLVATYELVEIDAVGKEKTFDEHQGFILSADKKPWKGEIRLATDSYVESTGSWKMSSSVDSDSEDVVVTSPDDDPTIVFGPEWNWKNGPLELELSEPGQHRFAVASRSDLSQNLALRVEARPRRIPGVPATELDQVTFSAAVRGRGGDIEWIRYLIENLEKGLETSEVPEWAREPEPEWREGKPESHVNLTIEPGVVAEIELTGPDGSGGKKTYHRGYIVASDLEPWEGKLRVGSLAGSSEIQWRIEGPFGSIAADIDPGWDWEVEPMATNSRVKKPDRPTGKVIAAGIVRSGGDTSFVSFVVKPVERKRVKADLPEVLPYGFMGLGDGLDWVEDIRESFRRIEMMNESEAVSLPETQPAPRKPTDE